MNRKTIIIGHRNPDTDCVAAAVALAELKKQKGMKNVEPAVAGIPGVRTEYIFNRFNLPLPKTLTDIHLKVEDVMTPGPAFIRGEDSLLKAIEIIQEKRKQRLPVVGRNKEFHGMLSLFSLLDNLLQVSQQNSDMGLTGRRVHSSVALIKKVIDGTAFSIHRADEMQDFEVFVAAMNIESFKEHIPREKTGNLAIVVGDRAEIHLTAISIGARLIIVTGSRRIDDTVVKAAQEKGTSIIRTPYDSATVIRRLKFSCPVEQTSLQKVDTYKKSDRICDIKSTVMRSREDVFPVVDSGRLIGSFMKPDIEDNTPCQLILVDHNEFDQGVEGIDEHPVVEIIDHHRFSMPPTTQPIKINCDIVGSTCTLITEMFLQDKLTLSRPIAGILMGGIVSDTLMLKSPTSTGRDKQALEALEKVTLIKPEVLTREIFKIGSLIAQSTPEEAITADRKNFNTDNFSFSISQIEEISFEQFEGKKKQLLKSSHALLKKEKLHLFGLLITDIAREHSILLAVGDDEILSELPFRKIEENLYDLPKILSRKKQLLPLLLKMLSNLEQNNKLLE